MGGAVQIRELDGRDRPSSGGLLPRLEGVDDLAGPGNPVDPDELDPLDVPDDGDVHAARPISHRGAGVRFMEQ